MYLAWSRTPAEQHSGVEPITVDLSFLWEFYLPHLPGMTNYFPSLSTFRQLWFDRAVGFYGWLDTPMPLWVDNLALIPAGLIAAPRMRTLIARRGALRGTPAGNFVYLVMSRRADGADRAGSLSAPGHGRDGLGAAPLPGAAAAACWRPLLAVAARGAGRRLGPAVGVLIVVLFLAQDIFGQLLAVARFSDLAAPDRTASHATLHPAWHPAVSGCWRSTRR